MIHRGVGFGFGGVLLIALFVLMALLGLALLLAVVLLPHRATATVGPAPAQTLAPPPAAPSAARVILDERLARGEITVEEYQRLRAALEAPPTS
jgi:putative membrane protein